jgi:hypothetical protein
LNQKGQDEQDKRLKAGKTLHFLKPESDQSHEEKHQTLLLEWIIKNNLSFSLVDQPETQALFKFLSPSTKPISRRVLMTDLKSRLISKKRTRISSENVRYVLCLRSWGFLVDDDDEEEILFDENGNTVVPRDQPRDRIGGLFDPFVD